MTGFSAGSRVTAAQLNSVTEQVTTAAGLSSLAVSTGMPAFTTDLGMQTVYNGSIWAYQVTEIASQVLTTTTGSVTFSGIPTGLTRLILDWRVRLSAAGQQSILMQVDGATGSSYLWSNIQITSGTVAGFHSGALTTSIQIGSADGNTASYFGSGRQIIDGWSNSTGFLTSSGHWNSFSTATTDQAGQIGGLYAAVGPHSSLKLFASGVSFAAGSQFSLYGEM